jgi:hypothetical protein
MRRSRIRKIAVAGVVLDASLSLWPATAGATHQPACPYRHRPPDLFASGWALVADTVEQPRSSIVDRNGNGQVCLLRSLFGSKEQRLYRDDVIL